MPTQFKKTKVGKTSVVLYINSITINNNCVYCIIKTLHSAKRNIFAIIWHVKTTNEVSKSINKPDARCHALPNFFRIRMSVASAPVAAATVTATSAASLAVEEARNKQIRFELLLAAHALLESSQGHAVWTVPAPRQNAKQLLKILRFDHNVYSVDGYWTIRQRKRKRNGK